jgi:hypothetical protein
MKKLFAMILIAGVFAACNGGSKSGNTDSTASSSDSSSVSKDTSAMKSDSMVNNAPDTVKAK